MITEVRIWKNYHLSKKLNRLKTTVTFENHWSKRLNRLRAAVGFENHLSKEMKRLRAAVGFGRQITEVEIGTLGGECVVLVWVQGSSSILHWTLAWELKPSDLWRKEWMPGMATPEDKQRVANSIQEYKDLSRSVPHTCPLSPASPPPKVQGYSLYQH